MSQVLYSQSPYPQGSYPLGPVTQQGYAQPPQVAYNSPQVAYNPPQVAYNPPQVASPYVEQNNLAIQKPVQLPPRQTMPNYLNKFTPKFMKRNSDTIPVSGLIIGVIVCLIIILFSGIIIAIINSELWTGLLTAIPSALAVILLMVEYSG